MLNMRETLADFPHCQEADFEQAARFAKSDSTRTLELLAKYERDYAWEERCDYAEAQYRSECECDYFSSCE
jgi:hypothetical protein